MNLDHFREQLLSIDKLLKTIINIFFFLNPPKHMEFDTCYCYIIMYNVICALEGNNIRRGEATKAPLYVLLNNAAFKS